MTQFKKMKNIYTILETFLSLLKMQYQNQLTYLPLARTIFLIISGDLPHNITYRAYSDNQMCCLNSELHFLIFLAHSYLPVVLPSDYFLPFKTFKSNPTKEKWMAEQVWISDLLYHG